MDLDPDRLRTRMREAVAARDEATMRELVSPTELPRLEPGSIFVLAAELWGDDDERRSEVCRILDRALRLYPGDFVLQASAGFFYDQADRKEDALVARAAAVGLRPGDVDARFALALSQILLGHLDEAQATLRVCLAADPAHVHANYQLGFVAGMLGDLAGSLASLSHVPEIAADPNLRADLVAAQYLNGLIDHDAYARKVHGETLLTGLATLLVPLANAADPRLRDPDLVLRTLEERAAVLGTLRWPVFLEALARARLEDWAGAQALLETRYALPSTVLVSPHCYEFLRSRVASGLGRDEEARALYARALRAWEQETESNPAAWEHSDFMRWKREAEAALRP
jgi:tetratricopeptide (TPR) repeat protein